MTQRHLKMDTADPVNHSKHAFLGHSGYIVAPWLPGARHDLVAIRHSASEPPWTDSDIHLHTDSEEMYFLLQGQLNLLVDDAAVTLQPREALLVKPQVPHAVVGGRGPIEHFVLRMPAPDDRQTTDKTPSELPAMLHEAPRTLQPDWGCRVSVSEARHQNCWLFGVGQARFHSDVMCLAYVSFSTAESLDADRHPHQLHLHRESWEVYTVIRGVRVLQIEDELVQVNEGEIVQVPPGVKHVLRATRTPFEGFTFRVPRLDDKVEF